MQKNQAEQALSDNEIWLTQIITSAMDAIISVDEAQRIVVFNPAAEQMFRCTAADVIDQPIDRFIPRRFRAEHARYIEQFGETHTTSRSMEALQALNGLRADGEEFPIEATIAQAEVGGQKRFTVIIRDITLRQQSEQERANLLAQAQHAREQAEEAARLRHEFLAIATHELKTPMAAMLGYTQLLEHRVLAEGTFSERDRRAVQVVAEQTERLNRLVEKLLDLSRIERGIFAIEHEPVDLRTLTEQAVERARTTLELHTLDYQGPDAPLMVVGDEVRLEQVLHNLLGNAVKYSPAGGVITVRLWVEEQQAVLAISDQGIGIPAEALPHLFQRFYRARNTQRQFSGMGIGLYLIKEIVSLHDGTLAVQSTEGEGSTFTVRLPREASC
jgi:PAS domain S-box-containing protein